ncbi:hypothetical protein [Aureivirga marina]|uniref:hypothetical protein n=1 Tax=Aureivirga marina TaxID=1182451 RepID=UPI0018CA7663|nr:hypothetical protein [Aureivirga marina]
MRNLVLTLGLLFVSLVAFSQEDAPEVLEKKGNKGKMFFYWGWNVSTYSDSDITFKGNGYNFTLQNVKANDRPTAFGLDPYFHPGRITIPQTNFRIGYFFQDNWNISLGVDHMKYVMPQNQTVKIDGTIDIGSRFDGVYNGENILLTEDFLKFEHTDGLNYVNIEVNRFDNFNDLLGIATENFEVNLTEGLGVGFLYPKTNTTLIGKERHDDFHVSGYGVSAKVGLNLTFFKWFFIQSELKGGFIDMPNIRTTNSTSDKASQNFFFFEKTIVFGARFRVFN